MMYHSILLKKSTTEITQEIYDRFYCATDQSPRCFSNMDRLAFDSARVCHVCGGEFSKMNPRVRNHCHFTGKSRSAAHIGCNLDQSVYVPGPTSYPSQSIGLRCPSSS